MGVSHSLFRKKSKPKLAKDKNIKACASSVKTISTSTSTQRSKLSSLSFSLSLGRKLKEPGEQANEGIYTKNNSRQKANKNRKETNSNFPLLIVNVDILTAQDDLQLKAELTDRFYTFVNELKWTDKAQSVSKALSCSYTDTKIKPLQANIMDIFMAASLNLDIITQNHNFLHCFEEDKRISVALSCLWSFFSDYVELEDSTFIIDTNLSISLDSNLEDIPTHRSLTEILESEIYTPFVRSLKEELSEKKKNHKNLMTLITSGQWVKQAICAFDTCSIDLCIAKVEKEGTKFSIIYANQSFEEAFGMNFDDIKGQDMFKMLRNRSSPEKISKLMELIQDGESAEAYIPCFLEEKTESKSDTRVETNRKHDDKEYLSFVKLEPVFSKINNECEFVICGQIDVTTSKWDANDLKLIDEVLWTLRNFL